MSIPSPFGVFLFDQCQCFSGDAFPGFLGTEPSFGRTSLAQCPKLDGFDQPTSQGVLFDSGVNSAGFNGFALKSEGDGQSFFDFDATTGISFETWFKPLGLFDVSENHGLTMVSLFADASETSPLLDCSIGLDVEAEQINIVLSSSLFSSSTFLVSIQVGEADIETQLVCGLRPGTTVGTVVPFACFTGICFVSQAVSFAPVFGVGAHLSLLNLNAFSASFAVPEELQLVYLALYNAGLSDEQVTETIADTANKFVSIPVLRNDVVIESSEDEPFSFQFLFSDFFDDLNPNNPAVSNVSFTYNQDTFVVTLDTPANLQSLQDEYTSADSNCSAFTERVSAGAAEVFPAKGCVLPPVPIAKCIKEVNDLPIASKLERKIEKSSAIISLNFAPGTDVDDTIQNNQLALGSLFKGQFKLSGVFTNLFKFDIDANSCSNVSLVDEDEVTILANDTVTICFLPESTQFVDFFVLDGRQISSLNRGNFSLVVVEDNVDNALPLGLGLGLGLPFLIASLALGAYFGSKKGEDKSGGVEEPKAVVPKDADAETPTVVAPKATTQESQDQIETSL